MPLRFIDHLVFRVSNLEQSARFYNAVLDQTPERAGDALVYRIEETLLFFTPATVAQPGPYNKEHIGLNHIAFGVRTLDKLRAIEARLTARQIAHSGIAIDRQGHREYIWLDDPDGLRVEFYLRQEE